MQNPNKLRTALTAQLEAAVQGKRLTDEEVQAAEMQCAVDYAQHLQSKYNLAPTMCAHAMFVQWVLWAQSYWGSCFVHSTGLVAPRKRYIVQAFLEWMQEAHAAQYAALDALTVATWMHAQK